MLCGCLLACCYSGSIAYCTVLAWIIVEWCHKEVQMETFGNGTDRVLAWAHQSRAATAIHHHGGDLAIDDLLFSIEVEHVDGRHLGGRAAGAGSTTWVGLVHQVCVRILLQVHIITLAWAVIGLVAFRGNNPVPAEVFKVHRKGVAAAAGLGWILITV